MRGEAIALAGGTTLFEQDENADAFYLLRWGRLAARAAIAKATRDGWARSGRANMSAKSA